MLVALDCVRSEGRIAETIDRYLDALHVIRARY